MQRPWGTRRPGVLEDQREGPCGWSRMNERGEWEEERVRRGHVSCGEDLGF